MTKSMESPHTGVKMQLCVCVCVCVSADEAERGVGSHLSQHKCGSPAACGGPRGGEQGPQTAQQPTAAQSRT